MHVSLRHWASLLLTLALASLATAQTNLVPFADFEAGTLTGWSEIGATTVSTVHVHGGTYSARATTGELRATFPTVVGRTYKVDGWLKIVAQTGSDWGGFRVLVSAQNWADLGKAFPILQATHGTEYVKVAFTFTATTTTSRLQIGYFGGAGRTMIVHLDDFRVFEDSGNTPPTIASATVDPVALGTLPGLQSFNVVASDANGAIRTISWDFGDGGRAQSATGSRRIVAPGAYVARVSVSDDDGAVTTAEVPWTATDPAWPTLTITAPADGATVATSSITASGQTSAPSLTLSSDRGSVATLASAGAWSTGLNLAPGWNRLLVQARDAAGHVATAERRVRYLPAAALAFAAVTVPATAERWQAAEVTFDLAGSAATHPHLPYAGEPAPGLSALDGVTVDALFTPDNWTTVHRRPTFLRQPYQRDFRSGEEWLYPTGAARWTARFAPPSAGTWRVRLAATEARGSAQSAEYTFTVAEPSSPLNRGPVRRAAGDPRYFEYADGTPYLGGGHGSGASSERFSYSVADNLAAFGPGNQQMLRWWISGYLWGSAWQPWNSLTLGYDGTVPHTGLALGAAYGDGLAAWRLDAANPLLFQGFMSGHAPLVVGHNYRVIVRWRTEGIAGPATAGQPHGICLKFTGWPTIGETGAIPTLVPHVAGDTPWHVAFADFTASTNLLRNLAAILENTTGGTAYIDEIALHEILAGGALGPQLLRSPRANSHLTFDPRRGEGLDHALALAEAADVQFRFVISEKQEWLLNHLGPDGLPAVNGGSFYGEAATPTRQLHEAYWRHLFARFGASRAVHSWELVNEAPPGDGNHYTLASHLATLAAADGNPHPASLSTWATLGTAAWKAPANAALDHTDFHCYVNGTGWLEPKAALAADSARFFHEYDLAALAAGFGKPVVWGEMGIDGLNGTDGEDPLLAQDTAGVWLHKLVWARCGPGGVYPLYWYDDNLLAHNLHGRFGAWRRFMTGVPLTNGRYVDAAAAVSNPALRVIGQRDPVAGRAHLWIDNSAHTWRAVVDGTTVPPVSGTVTINLGQPNAAVAATWWDTSTGQPASTVSLTADASGNVTLGLAALATDTAVQLVASAPPEPPSGDDWPQLQRDAARTGRTPTGVAPPYRARWVWLGPAKTLRNRDSKVGWPDDLNSRDGYSYPGLPTAVPFTIADSVQPVLAAGRLFVGTMEGRAHAISADDGSTLWSADLPGPTIATAGIAGGTVVFTTLTGEVAAFDVRNGTPAWTYTAGRAITGAPCVVDDRVVVGAQDGRVHCLEAATGTRLWRSERLAAPIHGGLCSDGTSVYVGSEDMVIHAINLADGLVRASHPVRGQSFRLLWPVFHNGRVWVSTVTTPIIGSEYVGENNAGSLLFADGTDLASEEANLLRWLAGDTNGGRWPEAGADWRHLFVLDATTLAEPFVVPAAPVDGVGAPAHPVVVDNDGQVLTYFKTKFPTLTGPNGSVFGTNFSIDLAAVDQATGRRIPIDRGRFAAPWPWETDNLYGLSVAGSQLWLRQNFRGTQVIDLATATARGVSAAIRHRDGGTFNFDIVYKDQNPPIATAQPTAMGRTAPIVAGGRVYFTETWGLTAVEHAQ
ncbi:MAG: PQQ-binding-like beta-propeller repeat protein [Opitutaceae bacterium]|nr:PQQ-binding-like beta-propeller repeat protein [Opitutaceae bacterium]